MSVYARTQRVAVRTLAIVAGTAIVAFALLVFVRLMVHTTQPAEAASVIYYPNFCLGGWKYPQHASGPAAVTGDFDPSKFNAQNSAYLESSIASQMFCGYFSVRNAKNPPTKAVISFNWLLDFKGATADTPKIDSYTSTSSNPSGISPNTGFTPPAATSTVSTTTPQTQSSSSSPNTAAVGDSVNTHAPSTTNGTSTTTEIPLIPNSTDTNTNATTTASPTPASPSLDNPTTNSTTHQPTTNSDSGTAPGTGSANTDANPPSSGQTNPPPAPGPAPASTPAPTSASDPAPAPSGDAPTTFNTHHNLGSLLSSLIISEVHAAEVDAVVQSPLTSESFKDYLEISYSLDGIRWTAIGRVNRDNWQHFSVEIPVTSWDEVKRLQVMVSVLPTIDEKPDIYLDSISMKAEYKQTVAELASQGLAAVSNAVDSLIGDGNGPENAYDIVADAPAPRPTTELRTKKLLFPSVGTTISIMHETFDSEGRASGKIQSKKVAVSASGEGASLQVSGSCGKKYFVVLTYRNMEDYLKRPRSFIVNRADECRDGHFSFDLASLSPETRGGLQYLVVGEQGEEGTWNVVSDIFPVTIEATTTVQIINQ